jgi:hypothetical protein
MAHRTAHGQILDMNQFKLANETEIAVGNARVNARGDQLGPGGQVLKTRDQVMTEFYQGQKGTKLSSTPVGETDEFALQADTGLVADILAEPLPADVFETTDPDPAPVANAQLEAMAKSQALAERLKNQRKKN